jgi:hypothetical protein
LWCWTQVCLNLGCVKKIEVKKESLQIFRFRRMGGFNVILCSFMLLICPSDVNSDADNSNDSTVYLIENN